MKKIIFILLFVSSLYTSGCVTYYTVNEPVDSLNFKDGRYYKILKIFYLKGKYDKVENTDIDYFDKYGEYRKVLVYTQSDSLNSESNTGKIRKSSLKKIIPLDCIKSLTLERRKTDLKASLLTGSIIIGAAVILYIISFSIALHSGKFRI